MDGYWLLGLFYIGVPTVLLYAAAILLVWGLLRWRRWGRAPWRTAFMTVGGAAVLLSIFGNVVTAWRRQRATETDVTPRRPIALAGEVLIDPVKDHREPDAADSRWEVVLDEVKRMRATGNYDAATNCGPLCRKILAMPGVSGVTVNPEHGRIDGISRYAIRYRLSASRCGVSAGNSWDTIETSSAWQLAPIGNFCAVAGPPPTRFDFALRSVQGTMFADNRPRGSRLEINLLPRPVYYRRVEIAGADGHPLLRRTIARPFGLAVPLASADNRLEVGLEIPMGEDDYGEMRTLEVDRALRAYTTMGQSDRGV